MKTDRFFILFGSFFAVLGGFFIVFYFTSGALRNQDGMELFPLIGGLFVLIGICIAGGGMCILFKKRRIQTHGKEYTGKIYNYEPNYSATINGMPLLQLVIRYYDDEGKVKEAIVSTDGVSKEPYPLGGTISFKNYRGRLALSGAASRTELDGERELLRGNIDVAGTASYVGTHCPNCGALVNAAIGFATECPYCGNLIRIKEDEL